MYAEIIERLAEQCREAAHEGMARDDIRERIIDPYLHSILAEMDAKAFLEYIKDDRELSFYYYDAQQDGVCAKPVEAAALMLERIALDTVE